MRAGHVRAMATMAAAALLAGGVGAQRQPGYGAPSLPPVSGVDEPSRAGTGIGDCSPPSVPSKRWSCRTGTQGVEGNPNCPPPYIPGVGYPKNWSCPTVLPKLPAQPPAPPLACASLAAAPSPVKLVVSAGGGTIRIGKRDVGASEHDYRCYLVNLTVPPENRKQPAFVDAADPKVPLSDLYALETDNTRKQIVKRMLEVQPQLNFATMQEAQENVYMRLEAIKYLQQLGTGNSGGSCRYYQRGEKVVVGASMWETYTLKGTRSATGNLLRSVAGASAYDAIMQITSATSVVECQAAMELTVLMAAAKAAGKARFDAAHPEGLRGIGINDAHPEQSVQKHIRILGGDARTPSNMVPGDWAYLQNKTGYATWANECRTKDPDFKGGYVTGENALYIGRGVAPGLSGPVQVYSGLGLWNQSEEDLRAVLSSKYNEEADRCSKVLGRPIAPVTPQELNWTMLARLHVGA